MKFVHVADLHLGKVLHQMSLLTIQRELLMELLTYMDDEDIRLLVIAGDVYDRLIPSQEAVALLDEFLSLALLKYHIEVLMISGNHDSSERMHFASSILSDCGLHIETHLRKEMFFVEKEKTRFYLLPFFKPSHVKNLFELDEVNSYQEAMDYYLKQQHLDSQYQNILITHQFIGKSSITSDSELPLSVGGSEVIDASLFQDFAYVALGHLHAPQKVLRETMRYSGSLMRYSFDEVHQDKSIVIVDTEDLSVHCHPLHPAMTLQCYRGMFEQFMDPDFITKKDDIMSFELENQQLIPHAIDQLRTLYPHLLQITYTSSIHDNSSLHKTIKTIEKLDLLEMFETFYEDTKKQPLSTLQKQIMQQMIEKVGENHENH